MPIRDGAMETNAGTVLSIWRYAVKSMMGENLETASVFSYGITGDRAYALIDSSDGKVVSAKNPRKWPDIFMFRASLLEQVTDENQIPPVQIILPDGSIFISDRPDINEIMSDALGRNVTLETRKFSRQQKLETSYPNPWNPGRKDNIPEMETLPSQDMLADELIPDGTFFDDAVIHLLTTATLGRLQEIYPEGRFDAARFRPNVLIKSDAGSNRFTEMEWVGKMVFIGDELQLSVTSPCPRCVMTTLPQGDLPRDSGILRTAVQHNMGNAGVYCSVIRGGVIRQGDVVRIR